MWEKRYHVSFEIKMSRYRLEQRLRTGTVGTRGREAHVPIALNGAQLRVAVKLPPLVDGDGLDGGAVLGQTAPCGSCCARHRMFSQFSSRLPRYDGEV